MSYDHVQFIGYAIDTDPKPGKVPVYLGLDDPRRDIEARCALMLRAMNKAHDLIQESSPPANTLKVFLAPEFFFRGNKGAYELTGDVTDVGFAIARLQAIAADEKWKDWVFGFGTILAVSSPTVKNPLPNPKNDPNLEILPIDDQAIKEVYNYALIQQGGLGSQSSSGSRLVLKEYLSTIDFISSGTAQGLLLENVSHLAPVRGSGPGRERQRFNEDGGGIFELGGLTWGVETCLDHLSGRLLLSPQLRGENEVQIQLIPSCGAHIVSANVVAGVGGYVFNVDGHRGHRASLSGVTGQTPVTQTAATLDAKKPLNESVSNPVSNDDIVLANVSPPSAPIRIDSLYRAGPGELVIFPAVTAPAARKVQRTITPVTWNAKPPYYSVIFFLVYDNDGNFDHAMWQPEVILTDVTTDRYLVPKAIDTVADTADGGNLPIKMNLTLKGASGGYDQTIWGEIKVPGFNCKGHSIPGFDFDGGVLQLDNKTSGKPPKLA